MSAPKPNIKPTPKDAGLTLTLQVSIYDQGIISVDGIPQDSMAGAYITVARAIYELEKQARKRNSIEGSSGVDSSPGTT